MAMQVTQTGNGRERWTLPNEEIEIRDGIVAAASDAWGNAPLQRRPKAAEIKIVYTVNVYGGLFAVHMERVDMSGDPTWIWWTTLSPTLKRTAISLAEAEGFAFQSLREELAAILTAKSMRQALNRDGYFVSGIFVSTEGNAWNLNGHLRAFEGDEYDGLAVLRAQAHLALDEVYAMLEED